MESQSTTSTQWVAGYRVRWTDEETGETGTLTQRYITRSQAEEQARIQNSFKRSTRKHKAEFYREEHRFYYPPKGPPKDMGPVVTPKEQAVEQLSRGEL